MKTKTNQELPLGRDGFDVQLPAGNNLQPTTGPSLPGKSPQELPHFPNKSELPHTPPEFDPSLSPNSTRRQFTALQVCSVEYEKALADCDRQHLERQKAKHINPRKEQWFPWSFATRTFAVLAMLALLIWFVFSTAYAAQTAVKRFSALQSGQQLDYRPSQFVPNSTNHRGRAHRLGVPQGSFILTPML